MSDNILPVNRFLSTLAVVAKEVEHLEWSRSRLFEQNIDAAWVESLTARPELAERLEAFVSRYGRLQDTLAGKLLPRWLLALADAAQLLEHTVFLVAITPEATHGADRKSAHREAARGSLLGHFG